MWHKEVEIIVSKAGGAGIFDPFYENKGIDYPIGYVRWTENRNLEEFLNLISEKKINVKGLISHRFNIEDAETVYKLPYLMFASELLAPDYLERLYFYLL